MLISLPPKQLGRLYYQYLKIQEKKEGKKKEKGKEEKKSEKRGKGKKNYIKRRGNIIILLY